MTAGNAVQAINGLICSSKKPLIIISRPVDPDCVGTARALRWLLNAQGRPAAIGCFFPIPPGMAAFPGMDEVLPAQPDSFDFSPFDLIITVDGSSWGQFLGDAWEKVLSRLDMTRLVNIDHHEPDEIARAIPDRCLVERSSSTAQVLYEHFIKPSQLTPPPPVAHCLYLALLYDTRGFKNEIHAGAYRFAETLIGLGADHSRAVDVAYDLREARFLAWAIAHTEFIADLHLMLLVIDAPRRAELEALFGDGFLEYDTIYKEAIQRQVAGFHYGVMLTDMLDGFVRLNWRTRGYGGHLAMADIARQAGFQAGGHRNAGGGSFRGSLEEAKTRLLARLRESLREQAGMPPGSGRQK